MLLGCSPQSPSSVSISTNTIKIGGSAETYEVLELLTAAYQAKTTDVEFDFLPPSQTTGGIQGVKSAAINIGGVSRVPTPNEIDNQVTYIPLVETPLVVVVHDSVTGISNLTSDELKAIYSGKINNWQTLGGPNAAILLFDFTEDENEKQILRQTYLDNDLVITPTAIVFAEDDKLLETAAITEFSIATVPYENKLHTLPLKTLSINGVSPSAKNTKSDQYSMTLPLGIVLDKQPSAAAESFLEFVVGPEGKHILANTNYITIDTNYPSNAL